MANGGRGHWNPELLEHRRRAAQREGLTRLVTLLLMLLLGALAALLLYAIAWVVSAAADWAFAEVHAHFRTEAATPPPR